MAGVVVSGRRIVLVSAVSFAVLGIACAALTWTDAALALFGAAGLAAFGWIVLWARVVNATLAALRKQIGAVDTSVKRTSSRADDRAFTRLHSDISRLDTDLRSVHKIVLRVEGIARQARFAARQAPRETIELGRLHDRLVTHDRPMPELGNWALPPGALVWIIERIRRADLRTIVECGSGSSTIWFATALEQRGGPGRIVALESDAEWVEITRSRLAELGLAHRVDVIHAPLVQTELPGRAEQPWYELANLPADLTSIDLLLVDGPVGALASEIRYPGFPLLADRLSAGATVILDDTDRSDEKKIVKSWLSQSPAGRRLTVTDRLDRSTVFTVEVEA